MRSQRIFPALLVVLLLAAFGGREEATAPVPAGGEPPEVVNGLQIELESEVRTDGHPKLRIHVRNAGDEAIDLVEFCPMFLEVQDARGQWRTYQHPRFGSDKLDSVFTFRPGHHELENEPVSAFTTLLPGKHRVRVSLAFDRGMGKPYQSTRLWTGVVRSNCVVVSVPE